VTEKAPRQALYQNPISYFGGLVVAGSVALLVVTVVLMMLLGGGSPYFGIFAFLVLPMFVVGGVLIVLFGMRRESVRRRRLHTLEAPAYPRIDLNDPLQRSRFGRAAVGAFLLVILLAVVGYHGFLFTESVTFCGRVCHTVMEPEYTAYQASPHARVMCVECHVGAGAGWYVKSKLSGVRQVFAVLFHTYETPIPVPIKDLRPARETCEECHWPQKFYGAQLVRNPHFRYDEGNTAEQITFLVKTGGGSPKLGQNAGIHFHMLIENQVTFAASDEKLQHIPWVSVRRMDGSVEEYRSTEEKLSADELAKLPKRVMDCMDCHNRPTHIYPPPEGAVDVAMSSGLISPALPWIKKVAVDALVKSYPDRETASVGIRHDITAYYADKYPQVATASERDIAQACDTVIAIYGRSVFPKMKVNWTSYASNIGHRNWPGCFRCHDGRHVTASGKKLTTECSTCHTMPQRGPLAPIGASVPVSNAGWHPWELKGKHATMLCSRCHAAGYRPPTECAECHKLDTKAPMMENGCDSCHAKEQEVQPINDCKTCHDSLAGLHTKGGHPDASCTDCHKPHSWKVEGREVCLACHDDKKDHYNEDKAACATCHEFTKS
jgi:hypothetical protein